MINEFRHAIEATGINFTGDIIPDGKLHRIHVEGDKTGSENAWYVFYNGDIAAGAFGCWKRNISEKWTCKSVNAMTPDERTQLTLRLEAIKKKREIEENRVHAECRKWCSDNWRKAELATASQPYLKRKGILPCTVKQLNGNLLVPVHDSAGVTHGIQFIYPDGRKKFKSGTVKHGNYFSIGTPDDNTLLIAEGYATGASLYESTGYAVAVAFDAGNLLHVAKTLRKKFPEYRLILCGDKTRGRGSSALKGAVDVELMLERKGKGDVVTLSCQKMKDAPPFNEMAFSPVITPIETTDPKRPDSSLYLIESENTPSKKKPKLSPKMSMALALLKLMSSPVRGKNLLGKCFICTPEWMLMCQEEQVYTRSAFYTAIKSMEDKNVIEISDGYVRLS